VAPLSWFRLPKRPFRASVRLGDNSTGSIHACDRQTRLGILTSVTAFDFPTFAQEIYSENPKIYPVPIPLRAQVNAGIDPALNADDVRIALEERFLLPALYGGEAGQGQASEPFEALVVLEAPSVPFTRKEWKTWAESCASPAEAINRHRKIFFKWAFAERSHADLFSGLLGGKPPTEEEFFRRLYITDIWKDAAFTKERNYVQYWQSQLEKEISGISTEDVVFVGKPAYKYGKKCVPKGKRHYRFPFPKPYTKNFETELRRGLNEFHGRPKAQPASARRVMPPMSLSLWRKLPIMRRDTS
jgi:hypothetical protein